MRTILNTMMFLVLALLIGACTTNNYNGLPSADTTLELAEFKQAIRNKYRDNDIEPILTRFYHSDAISTDPEGKTKIGTSELRPVYEEVIGSLVKVESYKTFVKGDAGWDWVNFHVSFPPGVDEQPFTFKMLFLWEKIDGEWWSQGEMYVMGEFDVE